MHLSPLRNSITSITTDLWQKICIVTKQNALFKEILNFLIDLRSVQINLHKGVSNSKNHFKQFEMLSVNPCNMDYIFIICSNFFHKTSKSF